MKSPKYDTTPKNDETLNVAVPAEMKARVYEAASKRGVHTSLFVRQVISAALNEPQAA